MHTKPREKIDKSSPSNIRFQIFAGCLVFIVFGIAMVYNVSVVESFVTFGDKLYLAKQQAFWAVIALVVMIISSKIPTKWLVALGPIAFAGSLLLLVIVLLPGIGIKANGARRWIDLGPVIMQPAELMKLSLILYLASWLQKPRRFLSFAILIGGIFLLIMLQPDLGTALILLAIAMGMYFISEKPLRHFVWMVGGGTIALALLIAIAPYRLDRVKSFLDPQSDPLGKSYHIRQITIALGNGGLFGQGLGNSKQKYRYIPEAATDSIFAVIVEEIGFVGGAFILFGYIALFTQMGKWVSAQKDVTAFALGCGIVAWLSAQVLVNLASVVALIPLTGVPLPFLSYGGSALVSQALGIGVLLGLRSQKNL